jgi:hypothetical protein
MRYYVYDQGLRMLQASRDLLSYIQSCGTYPVLLQIKSTLK